MSRIAAHLGMEWENFSPYEENFYTCCARFPHNIYNIKSKGNYSAGRVTSLHDCLKLIEHIAKRLSDMYDKQYLQEKEGGTKNPISEWLMSRGDEPIFTKYQEKKKRLQKTVARVRQAAKRIGLYLEQEENFLECKDAAIR